MHRPAVRLMIYLGMTALVSWGLALLVTPLLPYPFAKVLRRAATITAALTLPWFITRGQRWSWPALGLSFEPRLRREAVAGWALGIGMFAALFACLSITRTLRWYWPDMDGWLRLAAFLPAAAVIAMLEEVFFRGAVLQSLLADMGRWLAVALSSTLYSVLHFVKYLSQPLTILPELFGLFLFGCLLSYAFLRTRRLGWSIGLHMSAAYVAKVDKEFVEFLGREPRWLFGNDRWLTGAIGWGLLVLTVVVIHQCTTPPRVAT